MDAPSLHQAAHCRDRASGAGRPVDFPLSLLQRGPASPYISRSGHADFRGHPSAATNETTQLCPKDQKNYILVQDHGHIYMLSSLTCRWRSSSVSMVFLQCHCPKETSVFISQYQKTNMCLVIKTRSTFTAFAH